MAAGLITFFVGLNGPNVLTCVVGVTVFAVGISVARGGNG